MKINPIPIIGILIVSVLIFAGIEQIILCPLDLLCVILGFVFIILVIFIAIGVWREWFV